MLFETKGFFASKTIWGALLALASQGAEQLLPLVGVMPGEWTAIVGGFGAVLAIYGRLTAKKVIA